MTVFRLQVFKTIGDGRHWTNVYHTNAASLSDAAAAAATLVAPFEQSFLINQVLIDRALASNPATHEFIDVPLSLTGAGTDGHMLPLFNTAKMIVSVDAFGRPDLKYYRGGLTEVNTEEFAILDGFITGVEGSFATFLAAMTAASTPLVASTGEAWVLGTMQKEIQMRQLHRKRRKPVAP